MESEKKLVCDECECAQMNPNSVNEPDWCTKHNKFVYPLELACDDIELRSKSE